MADLIAGRQPSVRGTCWSAMEAATLRYRLGGLAYTAFRQEAGVPPATLRAWEGAYEVQALHALLLAEEWQALEGALQAEGIVALLVKGGWMCGAGYYAPGERPLDDLDVVVPLDRASDAMAILTESGWPAWSDRPATTIAWAGAAAFEPRGPARALGLAIDLHWDVDYGGLRSRGRSGPAERVSPTGAETPEGQLAITVEHFLKHWRCRTHLPGLADVARLLTGSVDLTEVWRQLRAGPWSEAGPALVRGVADWMGKEATARLRDAWPWRTPAGLHLPSIVSGAASRPGRLGGLGERWKTKGGVAAARELADALFPPRAWLRGRYGRASSTPAARVIHLGRMAAWSLGMAPSPLSPNQE